MNARDDTSAARTAHRVRTAATVLLLVGRHLSLAVRLSQFLRSVNTGAGLFALVSWVRGSVLTQRFEFRTDAVSVCLLGLVIVTAATHTNSRIGARILSPTAVEGARSFPRSRASRRGNPKASVPGTATGCVFRLHRRRRKTCSCSSSHSIWSMRPRRTRCRWAIA